MSLTAVGWWGGMMRSGSFRAGCKDLGSRVEGLGVSGFRTLTCT